MKHIKILVLFSLLLLSSKLDAQCDEWRVNLVHNDSFENTSPNTLPDNFAEVEKLGFWKDTLIKNKHCFSFEIGGLYKNYYGNTYIRPYFDTIIPRELRAFSGKDYYGFSFVPNFSFQTSILYHYKINRLLGFCIGLELINKKTILTTNLDTANKYQNCDIIKYAFNDLYFEIPLKMELIIKKFSIGIGANFSKIHINRYYEYNLSHTQKKIYDGKWFNYNLFSASMKCYYTLFSVKDKYSFRLYSGLNYYGAVPFIRAKALCFAGGLSISSWEKY